MANSANGRNRNVLNVIHYSIFGGPHNRIARLRDTLNAQGWMNLVLLPDDPGNATERLRAVDVEVMQMRLHRLRAKPDPRPHLGFMLGFLPEVSSIRRLIREQHIDLVVICGLANPHAAIAGRRAGVPVVWQITDSRTPTSWRRLMMPVVSRCADAVMFNGEAVRDLHTKSQPLDLPSVVYYPPVDTSRFDHSEGLRCSARARLGIPQDAFVVGMVANLSPMKGIEYFLRAASMIYCQRSETWFLVVGARYETHPAYNELLNNEIAHSSIPRDRFVFTGGRPDVENYYPAMDVKLITSVPRSEGTTTTAMEAMACRLPIVTTDVGAVREVVEDGVTGFVVPPADPEAIAQATLQLLNDPDLRVWMGEEARRRAVERFDVEVCAETHVRAFEAAIAHHNKNARKEATPVGDHNLAHEGDGRSRLETEAVSAESLATIAKALLACPSCRSALSWGDDALSCTGCGAMYRIVGGIPVLLPPVGDDTHKTTQIEYYDEETDPAFEVSRPHGTPRMYRRLLNEKFKRSIESVGSLAQQTVLTVCGGSGMDAEFLARRGAFVIASDISLGAAKRTRERAERFGVSIFPIVADAEHLPFADRAVDLVYVHDGLHHLTDPFTGLREMGRVTKRSISITEPVRAGVTAVAVKLRLAQEVEDAGNRVARLVPDEIARTLQSLGFSRVYRDRYAMYYKHRPGPVMRMLSAPGVFPAAVAGWHAANVVLGRVGNKIAVQGERSIT